MKHRVYANIRVATLDTNPVRERERGCSIWNTVQSTDRALSTLGLTLATNLRNSTGQGVRESCRGSAHMCTPAPSAPFPYLLRNASRHPGLLKAPSPIITNPLMLSPSYKPLTWLSCKEAGANNQLSTT